MLKPLLSAHLRLLVIVAAALVLLAECLPGQEGPLAKADAALAAPVAGFADSGSFTIYVNEEPIIKSTFDWKADGSFTGNSVLAVGGQEVSFKVSITAGEDGHWKRIRVEAPQGNGNLHNKKDKIILADDEGTGRPLDAKAGSVLWFDYQPVFVSQIVAAYDQEAGGEQTVPIIIIAAVAVDVQLERLETKERSVAGRDLELTKYRLKMITVDLFPWIGEDGKVYMIEVPAQYAKYVRDGFEGLMHAESEDGLVSKSEYEWTLDDEVMVPMRDGVNLATDIYRPAAEGSFPVVLVRTPYKKEMNELQAKYYARRGYVCAVQDCRGRFASEGKWVPFFHEPEDGYDTIEWLAEQSWSDGKVGMIGGSYLGWVQWWAGARKTAAPDGDDSKRRASGSLLQHPIRVRHLFPHRIHLVGKRARNGGHRRPQRSGHGRSDAGRLRQQTETPAGDRARRNRSWQEERLLAQLDRAP